jgi:hypothetical protein
MIFRQPREISAAGFMVIDIKTLTAQKHSE